MFLWWGGWSFNDTLVADSDQALLGTRTKRCLTAIHQLEFVHTHVRSSNILYNLMTDQIIVIDLERALLPGEPRVALGWLLLNKRRWKVSEGQKKMVYDLQISCGEKRKTFFGHIRDAKLVLFR